MEPSVAIRHSQPNLAEVVMLGYHPQVGDDCPWDGGLPSWDYYLTILGMVGDHLWEGG